MQNQSKSIQEEEEKMAFKEMDIHELQFNPFDKISRQWMLVTA